MSLSIRLVPEVVRSIDSGTIGAAYMGIGTPADHPVRIFFVQNLTDGLLMFSFDGVVDHFPLPATSFLLLDVTTNKTVSAGCFIAQDTRIYVKEITAPTTGSVYVTFFYGRDV